TARTNGSAARDRFRGCIPGRGWRQLHDRDNSFCRRRPHAEQPGTVTRYIYAGQLRNQASPSNNMSHEDSKTKERPVTDKTPCSCKTRALPVFELVRPCRGWLAIVFVAMIFETVATLAAPWPLKIIIDNVIGKHKLPEWLH